MGYASSGRDALLGGFDLLDGQPALPDFRFADDIVSFEKSFAETALLLAPSTCQGAFSCPFFRTMNLL